MNIDTNKPTLPLPQQRCLDKHQAAAYLGIGVTLLTQIGPQPVKFGRRRVYDRLDLDKWLEEYNDKVLSQNTNFDKSILTINMKMTYFNSASSKFLLDILLEFMKFHSKGNKVEINWYYEEGDDEIQESGEEISDMLGYPFSFISYKP